MSQPIRALVVEDSDKDAELLLREIRRAGIVAVTERVDHQAALLRALDSGPWDIVLADHKLPGMDSFRAIQIVHARDPEVPCVIVSGTMGEELAVEAMRAGARDYLVKGRLARLGEVIRREIAEAGVRRERALALEALRDSEARKAAMLDASLDAVITIDHRGHILDFNRAAERMFGYRREEAVGKPMADLLVPPAARDRCRRGLARYLASGEARMPGTRVEVSAMRADGSELPAELAVVRIAGPGLPVFTGFVRDLTDRKKLEMRQRVLADAGARLQSLDCRAMLRDIAELVAGEAADWCGISLLRSGGEPETVATARRPPVEGHMAVEPSAEIVARLAARVARERKPEVVSLEPSDGGGSCMVVPLVARGRSLGVLAIATAQGQRARGQVDLALAEELAARCAMAVDNACLFEQVRESVRLRDDFIAIAAHELRTPLTPLRIQAEALAAKLASGRQGDLAPERLATPVRFILRSFHRLGALVERLLGFSELTLGGIQLDLEDHDLVALAREAAGEMSAGPGQVGVEVEWSTPAAPVAGRWDRRRVKAAIQSFLGNAAKFASGKPVVVTVRADDHHARLSVRDEGPGLSPQEQAQIFERYKRPAPLQNYGGFGLGLWIARRVAEEHGGHLEVRSEPGKGAEFTLVLPRRPPADGTRRPLDLE